VKRRDQPRQRNIGLESPAAAPGVEYLDWFHPPGDVKCPPRDEAQRIVVTQFGQFRGWQ
jgi:hypothetical protein